MSEPWIPTVDDLRVKMCYICREEERYDCPAETKTAWTHPCNCTLIAHESCLLHWIQTSQQNPSRAEKAFNCPQCGAKYEIESNNPLALRVLDAINKRLSHAGKVATYVGISVTVFSIGTCVYLMCTTYGAWAVRQFLGKEMFDILLTDDPANWPWHAYLHLPLVPFSLLASGSNLFKSSISPIFPLFLAWPSSLPERTRRRMLIGQPGPFDVTFPPLLSWPPPPILISILYPFTTSLYRRSFTRFQHWILDTKPVVAPAPERFIWNLNEGAVNLEIQVDDHGAQRQQQDQRDQAAQPNGDEVPEGAAEAAARTLRINNGSLGRIVGGTLILPKISSLMGSLLFRLSKHSNWLKRLLAIKPPLSRDVFSYGPPRPHHFTQFGQFIKAVVNMYFGGTKMWQDADPVWWRNSLGLGIYIVVRDCIGLLHLYLAKQELETRRVKNKSFAGIDFKELDLVGRPLD